MDGMRGACELWLRVVTHLLGVGNGSHGVIVGGMVLILLAGFV